MVHNKSDFMNNVDKSFLIESVIDSQKNDDEKSDDDSEFVLIKENKNKDQEDSKIKEKNKIK